MYMKKLAKTKEYSSDKWTLWRHIKGWRKLVSLKWAYLTSVCFLITQKCHSLVSSFWIQTKPQVSDKTCPRLSWELMAKPKLASSLTFPWLLWSFWGEKNRFKYKNDPWLFAENVYEKIKYEDIMKGYPQFLHSDRILIGASSSRH